MTLIKTSTLAIASLLAAVATCSVAQATSAGAADWAKSHPRRAEVNARLANQNQRIKTEVAEGEMSKAKAARLHQEDHRIRQEERDMAAHNGGHITKGEQRVLNAQENRVSSQIGK